MAGPIDFDRYSDIPGFLSVWDEGKQNPTLLRVDSIVSIRQADESDLDAMGLDPLSEKYHKLEEGAIYSRTVVRLTTGETILLHEERDELVYTLSKYFYNN